MSIDTIALRVRTMDIPFNIIDPNAVDHPNHALARLSCNALVASAGQ